MGPKARHASPRTRGAEGRSMRRPWTLKNWRSGTTPGRFDAPEARDIRPRIPRTAPLCRIVAFCRIVAHILVGVRRGRFREDGRGQIDLDPGQALEEPCEICSSSQREQRIARITSTVDPRCWNVWEHTAQMSKRSFCNLHFDKMDCGVISINSMFFGFCEGQNKKIW